jgi:hypothetical protein
MGGECSINGGKGEDNKWVFVGKHVSKRQLGRSKAQNGG